MTVCVYTNDSCGQVLVYTVSSMISSIYMAGCSPFEELLKNRIETFSEIMVFICGILQMAMVGFTVDTDAPSEV